MIDRSPVITSDQAAAFARTRAQEQGWGLAEPLSVELRRSWTGHAKTYAVRSNRRLRGTKTWFTIDAHTGAILSEGYIPR